MQPNAPLKKIVLVLNSKKSIPEGLADALEAAAQGGGAEVVVCRAYPLPEGLLQGADACFTVGGDGTLLTAVPQAVAYNVPLAGIHCGKLGFLPSLAPETAAEHIAQFVTGNYTLQPRMLLSVHVGQHTPRYALNDCVLKSANARLLELSVAESGQLVSQYSADGIICATPTGSTAYNLSAGGPILYPAARALALTPICPHSFSGRSVVFPESAELTLTNECAHPAELSIDGKPFTPAGGTCQQVTVRVAQQSLQLMLPTKGTRAPFAHLKAKLGW